MILPIAIIGGIIVVLAFLNAYWSWRGEAETRARVGPANEWRVRPMTWMRLRAAAYILIGTLLVLRVLLAIGVR